MGVLWKRGENTDDFKNSDVSLALSAINQLSHSYLTGTFRKSQSQVIYSVCSEYIYIEIVSKKLSSRVTYDDWDQHMKQVFEKNSF